MPASNSNMPRLSGRTGHFWHCDRRIPKVAIPESQITSIFGGWERSLSRVRAAAARGRADGTVRQDGTEAPAGGPG